MRDKFGRLVKTEYVKLKRLDDYDEVDRAARSMGWRDGEHFYFETGGSLGNKYVDVGSVTRLPKNVKKGKISPIAIIVHGRLFEESASGYKTSNGEFAYIEYDKYQNLF
jgi:hypothetical protein